MTLAHRHDDYNSAIQSPLAYRMLGTQGLILSGGTGELYAQGGIHARIVDKPAEDAVARGVRIEVRGAGEQGDDGIQDEYDRLVVLPKLAQACKWARLYGGGVLVPICDDAPSVTEPLNVERLSTITGLMVFAGPSVSVRERYTDPTQANYDDPAIYEITKGRGQFYVHESRVIPVAGATLPRSAQQGTIPWVGRAEAQASYQAIDDWQRALTLAMQTLDKKQQPVYLMKGLTEMLTTGDEQQKALAEVAIQRLVGMVDAKRNMMNTVITDGDDKYNVFDLSVSGIDSLISKFEVAVSAQCGIPVAILFGRSAAGLNSTGEADFEGYYDLLEVIQRRQLTPALERLTTLILAQSSFPAAEQPQDTWRIVWNPLKTLSEKDQAEVDLKRAQAAKTQADAHAAYVSAGILSPERVLHAMAVGENEYGITPQDLPPADPAADASVLAAMGDASPQTGQ